MPISLKEEVLARLAAQQVVHPLFDEDETKVDFERAGPMTMTRSVKWSLMLLRVYLLAMLCLVGFKLLR